MPTYGYECQTCKEQFEIVQKMTDDALKVHEGCGGPLKKLLYPVGIAFKGSGFYVNDYAKSTKKEASSSSSDSKTEKPEAKVETKTETKSESKTESASSTTPAATTSSSN